MVNKNKKKNTNTNTSNSLLPFVSVCTPTFNRRPFIPAIIKCFQNQTYPKERMEWIIIDDGTDNIEDLVKNIPQVKYFKYHKKMSLGEKRNLMHDKSKGDILVYMDDDDYYPPERVSHSVSTLLENPNALCAGSSIIYIWFNHIDTMWQFGPYGPNHATAGTFAFKRELLKTSRYNDKAAVAEEKEFLKGYTVPFVQLDPLKTILCFSHQHNTFDKKKLLEINMPEVSKPMNLSVEDIIKDTELIDFYKNKVDNLLNNYALGKPEMKPDVLKQIREIEDIRNKSNRSIIVEEPGKEPRVLTTDEIVKILDKQTKEINNFSSIIQNKDKFISLMKNKIQEQEQEITYLKKELDSLRTGEPSSSIETPNIGSGIGIGIKHIEPTEVNMVSLLQQVNQFN